MKLFAGGPGTPIAIVAGVAAEAVVFRMAVGAMDPGAIVVAAVALIGVFGAVVALARWTMKAVGREIMAEAKKDADKQRVEDQVTVTALIEESKDEAKELVREAARQEAEERADMHEQNQRIATKTYESMEKLSESMRDIGFALFGGHGRHGVWEELDYAGDIRHQMIEHIQAIEATLHAWGEALAKQVPGCTTFIQPPPIHRRRRRSDT